MLPRWAILLLVGCASPTRISVASVDRLRVTGVAGPSATVELGLSVKTNAPVDSTVTVLAYEIAFGTARPIARGGRLAPVKVPAGGVVTLTLPAELALSDLPADLPAQAETGAIRYRATVWIEAESVAGRTTHRLEPSGDAPLAETFAAVVDGVFAEGSAKIVDVGPLAVEGAELVIGVVLEFPGHLPFPVRIRHATYEVSLTGSPVGRGESSEPFEVAPGRGGRGRFGLRAPVARVPGALGKLALGEREIVVEGTVEIEPIGPIRRVPFRAKTRVR